MGWWRELSSREVCPYRGITSIVVPKEQFAENMGAPWRGKKLWLAAWVMSQRPGYRFLALSDSELRITDCSVFEKQSLLGAIEESYAKKRWTGGNCEGNACKIQLASAAAVARSEEELAGLERAGATCAYTWQNEFPWVEVTSFTDMLRAVALKYDVRTTGHGDILEIVQGLLLNAGADVNRGCKPWGCDCSSSGGCVQCMGRKLAGGWTPLHEDYDCNYNFHC